MVYLQKAALTDGRDVYEMLQRIPPENGFLNSCYQMDWTDFPKWLAKRVDRSQGIGHIGYAVDGTKQNRGYGKALLGLMIQEARRMGITEELLVTVHPDNTASRKVAEASGGELRRETAEHVYYWFV